jgi:non-heme chloroperoxidase
LIGVSLRTPYAPSTRDIDGDDDQIVLIADSAMLSSKIVKGATLRVIAGAPHGMCSTHKDQINAELLAFIKGERAVAS